MSAGLLCAAELNATSATRRTFRSGSCNASRNSPIELRSNGSITCGYKGIANVDNLLLHTHRCRQKQCTQLLDRNWCDRSDGEKTSELQTCPLVEFNHF